MLLGLKVSDARTGAKTFRRRLLGDIVKHLIVKRYFFDAELLTAATARDYREAKVPALWRIRLIFRFKAGEMAKPLIDLVAVAYRHEVKRLYV